MPHSPLLHDGQHEKKLHILVVRTPYPYIQTQTRLGTRLSRIKKWVRPTWRTIPNASEPPLYFNCNRVVVACRTAANCERLDEAAESTGLIYMDGDRNIEGFGSMELKSLRRCTAHDHTAIEIGSTWKTFWLQLVSVKCGFVVRGGHNELLQTGTDLHDQGSRGTLLALALY